ncbi:MAG: FISUMP domain-containing protein [Marinifilaceae bacterium]
MKEVLKIALFTIGILSIVSCSDDDIAKNQEPSVPSIALPADKAKDVAKEITLKWNASTDPEKGDVKYDLYFGTKEELTDEDIKAKDQAKTEYTLFLQGHVTYYWKVIAKDDAGNNAESKVNSFTTENSAPNKAVVSFPEDKAADVEKTLTFKWAASTDADRDEMKYFLYLAKQAEFTDADLTGDGLETNEFKVENLEGHTQYFWKVVTKDSEGASSESDVYSFTTQNTLPGQVKAVAPVNEATDVAKVVKLQWTASVDEDKDVVKYNLYLAEKNTFTQEDVVGKELEVTEFEIKDLKAHTWYFWKVVALDSEGASVASEVYSFSTINAAPSKPVVKEVVQEVTEDKLSVVVKWTASEDADKDAVTYDLFITKNDKFVDSDLVRSGLDATELEVTTLNPSTDYKLKIVGKDNYGGVAESDVFSFTSKEYVKPAPKNIFTDSRDGHVYKTVVINGKTWLAENFAYIPYVINDDNPKKRCSVIGVNINDGVEAAKAHENFTKYGVLYSWDILEDVVPDGWHVATEEEWQALEKLSGMTDDEINIDKTYRGSTAAKFKAKTEWAVPGTDELGLNILPAGSWKDGFPMGSDYKFGERAYFWTSTSTSYFAKMRAFDNEKKGIYRKSLSKTSRYSIRLVKDSE